MPSTSRRVRSGFGLLALALAPLAGAVVAAPSASAFTAVTIQGTLKLSDGSPVPLGTSLTWTQVNGGGTSTAQTDATGHFALHVVAGPCTLLIDGAPGTQVQAAAGVAPVLRWQVLDQSLQLTQDATWNLSLPALYTVGVAVVDDTGAPASGAQASALGGGASNVDLGNGVVGAATLGQAFASTDANGHASFAFFQPTASSGTVSFGSSWDVPATSAHINGTVAGLHLGKLHQVTVHLGKTLTAKGQDYFPYSVFRAGHWFVRKQYGLDLGLPGDLAVPGYYGNGLGPEVVFRSETGGWYWHGKDPVYLGLPGDLPVPADYDGDGKRDIAVYRPSTGAWYIQDHAPIYWGLPGDIPVPADYNGDGKADIAVYRDGAWLTLGQPTVYNGRAGDIPVPADYDGNLTADRVVYRGGAWISPGGATTWFGLPGDVPQLLDLNADGIVDRAVFRGGAWYVEGEADPVFFGLPGDQPLNLPAAIYQRFF